MRAQPRVHFALQGFVYGVDIMLRHGNDPAWPAHARYHVMVSGVHIVALALIIERMFHLRENIVAPPRLIDEVIGVMRQHLPSAEVIMMPSRECENTLAASAGPERASANTTTTTRAAR
mgnify:CR=1 FL=1